MLYYEFKVGLARGQEEDRVKAIKLPRSPILKYRSYTREVRVLLVLQPPGRFFIVAAAATRRAWAASAAAGVVVSREPRPSAILVLLLLYVASAQTKVVARANSNFTITPPRRRAAASTGIAAAGTGITSHYMNCPQNKYASIRIRLRRNCAFRSDYTHRRSTVGVKAFFDMMHSGPHKVMLFGAACTQVTDPIAKASKHWRLTQMLEGWDELKGRSSSSRMQRNDDSHRAARRTLYGHNMGSNARR
ncbi:unnamed protein product [Trichogramma brassicae]|uniref:Uncharacterized protein n=1 Tax=Trichogramma brassicae TaxID=86971 RepID=A0A6H5IL86_9HYME|nr:unnamed protein product [Trichogramma brassicae]